MADEVTPDTMEIVGLKFVGFRTFFIAIMLVAAYVYLLASGKDVGDLAAFVGLALGFMFGMKGASAVTDAVKSLNKPPT